MPEVSPGFGLSIEPSGAVTTITCEGEIDLATAGRLEEALATALDGQASTLALDLQRVTFCGSEGIRVLLKTKRACNESGKKLVLRLNEAVGRVLEIADVKRHLTLD